MKKNVTYAGWVKKIYKDYKSVDEGYTCFSDCNELLDYDSCLQCPHFRAGHCSAAQDAYKLYCAKESWYGDVE